MPYVWSLAVADTWLPWRHSAIVLFNPAAASSDRSPTTSVRPHIRPPCGLAEIPQCGGSWYMSTALSSCRTECE